MSQLNGKQIKDSSVLLDKLSGSGIVTFSSATMSFGSGANLFYADAPTQATEVANKAYVDSVASGLEVKEAAQVIATFSVAGTYTAGVISGVSTSLSIDGIPVSNGARVVLNGQTALRENGIYVYDNIAGTLTRAEDMDETSEVNGGEFVFIKQGNTYADTGWVVSTPDSTMGAGIGGAPIKFTQFSSAGVIQAGLGLVQNGNTFDVITGVGLTASDNELKLANTGVNAGSYGSATRVSTFTVDDQGRLTAAGTTNIAIQSTQVTDFVTKVNTEVFNSTNFIDSATVDFNVTAGATVSADVKVNPTTGLTVSASGVEINYGAGLTVSGNQLVVDSSTFGVQGADNGLSIDGSSNVVLGGTLSQHTKIDGLDTYNLTFDNLNLTEIDAGTISLTASSLVTISAESGIYRDISGTPRGLRYAGPGYVTGLRSLTDKDYVDTEVSNAIVSTTYFATDGITLTGNTFSLAATAAGDGLSYASGVLAVNVDTDALQIVSDTVQLKDTIAGDRTFSDSVTINGNLTVSGTVSTVNTTDLVVKDNVITLNDGQTGGAITAGSAGIEIDRGSSAFAKLIFDENDDLFYAGLSGSLHAIVTQAGTGLTKTGNELKINTADITPTLAGNGLTASGNTLHVRATNGLSVWNSNNSDSVELGGSLTRNTTIDGNSSKSLTFDNLTTFTTNANSFTVQSLNGVYTDLNAPGSREGLKYAASGYVTDNRSLTDKEYVDTGTASLWTAINAITSSDIEEVVAGSGLTGGGTQGVVTIDVNTGAGLTISSDAVAIALGTNSGLSLSGGTLKVASSIAGSGLAFSNGVLSVTITEANPVYDKADPNGVRVLPAIRLSGDTFATHTGGHITTLSGDIAPDSRFEVYINGLKASVGYSTGSQVANLPGYAAGYDVEYDTVNNELKWWGAYDLDADDVLEIVYEA